MILIRYRQYSQFLLLIIKSISKCLLIQRHLMLKRASL
ncbi:hypothetical protein CV83915_2p0269 (plasmid) [Escherichia coli]|uniref:Uncharacterized protein n=1 Tax=Escherichia coli TaxID=562 RepID=A0A2H4TL52_ECOLX|nr:hypothetical protein CV83915_2p0269 [Escherichia coli]